MNREIKFRIWNGTEMVYDVTTGKFGTFYVNPEKGDGLNPKDTACLSENTTKYSEDIPLMQYTGLKDKNEKEIYEGDIIKYNQHHFNSDLVKIKTKEVKWKYDKWGIFETNAGESEIEVIGNIYKNPELILMPEEG